MGAGRPEAVHYRRGMAVRALLPGGGWPTLGLLVSTLLSLFSPAALAQPIGAEFLRDVKQRRLDNGLAVVVQEDHRVPLASLSLRYDCGEAESRDGLAGTAIVTMYSMIRGATKHVPAGDYTRLLDLAGASNVHDATWTTAMGMDVTVPANRLALPLWLWSDQMGFFDQAVDDVQIAAQKSAVREQHRTQLDGSPTARLDMFASEELYPEGHPQRSWFLVPDAVDHVDRAAVIGFHDRCIVPARATLVIVGDVVAADAFALVDRYFGTLPRGADTHPERAGAAPPAGEATVDVAANVQQARVSVRWLTPRELTVDDGRLDVVARILKGDRTACLFWKLVDEKKIATAVSARQRSGALESQFEVSIDAAPGKTAAEVLAAFDGAMDDLRARVFRQGEIEHAIYETLVDRLQSLESVQRRAWQYAKFATLVGTPNYVKHDADRYRDITPGTIRATIEKWLPRDRRVVILVTPAKAAAAGGERRGRRFVSAVTP
jgi:zinc protease